MSDKGAVVPFGKYKGQPVEVLRSDPNYLAWLTGQDWFRERFANVYQVVVNNFAEPSETPEHNHLQAMFLDDFFCLALLAELGWEPLLRPSEFIEPLLGKHFTRELVENLASSQQWVEREKQRLDRMPEDEYVKEEYQRALKRRDAVIVELANAKEKFRTADRSLKINISRKFEDHVWDVFLTYTIQNRVLGSCDDKNLWVCVEIKPSIGDDYPAVLRQVKSYHRNCQHPSLKAIVVFREFTAVGATLEQVRAIFGASGILVIPLAQVEQLWREVSVD